MNGLQPLRNLSKSLGWNDQLQPGNKTLLVLCNHIRRLQALNFNNSGQDWDCQYLYVFVSYCVCDCGFSFRKLRFERADGHEKQQEPEACCSSHPPSLNLTSHSQFATSSSFSKLMQKTHFNVHHLKCLFNILNCHLGLLIVNLNKKQDNWHCIGCWSAKCPPSCPPHAILSD